LDDLCRQMFEMVQYKNYHADESRPPYPLDHEVAKWVRDVAEPRGIVNKDLGIFVDNRPFVKPTYGGGIRLGPGRATKADGSSGPSADYGPRLRITGLSPSAPGPRIRFRT
jgi:hypothetical protein